MKKVYQTILLEEIRDQNKSILEGQKDQASSADIRQLQQDVTELKQDMKVVKAAVKATNSDMADVSREVEKHKGLPAHVAHEHA